MSRFIGLQDLTTAVSLCVAGMLSVCPRKLQHKSTRMLARTHVRLRGSRAAEIGPPSLAPELDLDPRKLEQDFLEGVYREMVYTLREYRGAGWNPQTRINGRDHLDQALSRGKGGVLWAFPCTYGGLVGKKALHAAGYEVAMLASHVHPYSGTRFGMRCLNPFRTRIEDRYIVERVTLNAETPALAMRRVVQLLASNKLVEIAAIGAADSPGRVPFFGGTLNLALGAPTVAIMGGAALLPYFPIPIQEERFEVCIHPPLEAVDAANPRQASIHLARQYGAIMKDYVARAPHVWRGWFNRTNWIPQD